MKNKILLGILSSDSPVSMSEIAEKTKSDIQLVNYHLKKMVSDGTIQCIYDEDTRKYDVHPIVRESKLYDALFAVMTVAVPEFYEALGKKELVPNCIKQVLIQVLNDVEIPDN